MKCLKIPIIAFLGIVFMFSVAMADSITDVSINPDTQKMSVSGNITDGANKRASVQILYPNVTEEDIKTVNESNFKKLISMVSEVTTDNDGNFKTNEYALGDVSGYYSVRVTIRNREGAPTFFDKAFLYIAPNFSEEFLKKMSSDFDDAYNFFFENIDILKEDAENIKLMDEAKKKNILSMVISDTERYINVDEFMDAFDKALMISDFADSDNAEEKINLLDEFMEKSNYVDEYSPYLIFVDFTKEAKEEVIRKADTSGISKFFDSLAKSSILYSLNNTANQTNITSILCDNEAWLGFDISAYKNYAQKRNVNTAIIDAKPQTLFELETVIERAMTKKKGTSSGGGGGGLKSTSTAVVPKIDVEFKEEAKALFEFCDMTGFEWAKEAVYELYSKQIINGVGNNCFAPNIEVTREEYVKMLMVAFGIDFDLPKDGFSDVKDGAWYSKYVLTAKKLGLVNGKNDNSFGVGEKITRQDMACMAYRFLQYAKVEINAENNTFNDFAEVSDYAKQSVNALSAMGIINGFENNTFMPKKTATRAESAKIIYEIMKKC